MGLFSFVKSQLLKVIEWSDTSTDTIVYKFPMDGRQIMNGSKLTVRESQVAIFVDKGKIADIFTPGIYKLDAANLPLLTKLLSLPFGFKSPFYSEVYFINTKQFTNQKWGTTNPITLRDADFGTIRIRGYGTYSFRVNEPEKLLKELFGTNSTFKTSDITDYLRSFIIAGISDTIAESKISALDMAANLLEFNKMVASQIENKFIELGLQLVSITIENISFPESVEKAIDTRTSMGVMGDQMNTYVKYTAANALSDAAKNPNGNNLASAGVGLGAGVTMGNLFSNAFNSNSETDDGKTCPKCNAKCKAKAKFCPECGADLNPGIVCPKCNAKVGAKAKFCPECGEKIVKQKVCTKCGAVCKPSAKFCPECGEKV